MSRYGHAYRKGQKLNKREVLQFIGFHPDIGKAFAIFALSVLKMIKKVISQIFIRKTFVIL